MPKFISKKFRQRKPPKDPKIRGGLGWTKDRHDDRHNKSRIRRSHYQLTASNQHGPTRNPITWSGQATPNKTTQEPAKVLQCSRQAARRSKLSRAIHTLLHAPDFQKQSHRITPASRRTARFAAAGCLSQFPDPRFLHCCSTCLLIQSPSLSPTFLAKSRTAKFRVKTFPS